MQKMRFTSFRPSSLPQDPAAGNHPFDRADAVAPLTRLAGSSTVKEPALVLPRLTWTGLDVGGPWLEAFG
jgi:hypothetical protein